MKKFFVGNKFNTGEIARFLPDTTDIANQINCRQIYNDALENAKKEVKPKNCTHSGDGFVTLKTDNIVRKRLVGLKTKSEKYPQPIQVEDVISFVDKNIWKYDGNKLYRYNSATDSRIDYGDEDQATLEALKVNNNCYTTNVTDDPDACKRHVYECLLDNDSKGLDKCWIVTDKITTDFYTKAKKDIGSMHPMVALRTLQRFGFRTTLKYDSEAQMDLNKVESVDHWKNNYLDVKFPKESDTVKKNENLLKYLDLVVQYVNSNPALINKHYSGKSSETVGKWTQSILATRLNLQPRYEPHNNNAVNEFTRLQKHQQSGLLGLTGFRGATILRPPFGNTQLLAPFSTPTHMNFQMGGSMQAVTSHGSALVRNSILTALKTMQQFNKELDANSKLKIEEKIANMAKVENELNRTATYLAEYSNLLEVFGDYQTNTLSEAKLESITSRYNNLLQKHNNEEKSMMTVLQALHKIADGQESDELTEVNNYTELRGRV
jgi:hypothetical protein